MLYGSRDFFDFWIFLGTSSNPGTSIECRLSCSNNAQNFWSNLKQVRRDLVRNIRNNSSESKRRTNSVPWKRSNNWYELIFSLFGRRMVTAIDIISKLVTDIADILCRWQFWDDGNRFFSNIKAVMILPPTSFNCHHNDVDAKITVAS